MWKAAFHCPCLRGGPHAAEIPQSNVILSISGRVFLDKVNVFLGGRGVSAAPCVMCVGLVLLAAGPRRTQRPSKKEFPSGWLLARSCFCVPGSPACRQWYRSCSMGSGRSPACWQWYQSCGVGSQGSSLPAMAPELRCWLPGLQAVHPPCRSGVLQAL